MENNEFLSVFNETGYPNLAFKELTGIEHAIINIALGNLGRDPCIAIDMLMRRYNDGGTNSSDLAHYTYEACPQHSSREDGFFHIAICEKKRIYPPEQSRITIEADGTTTLTFNVSFTDLETFAAIQESIKNEISRRFINSFSYVCITDPENWPSLNKIFG